MKRDSVIQIRDYRDEDQIASPLPAATLDELPDGTKLLHGQYTITDYLNSGGFGITYNAADSLGRPVVIKECFPSMMCRRQGAAVVPRATFGEELAQMIREFVQEAHSLAALSHQNIVHVHQVFEENGTAYMVIDFINGLDLLEIIESFPERLTPGEIMRLTRATLEAIGYVHSQGMLHRDISPDNILIDSTGEPVLIDFGAARLSTSTSRKAFSKLKFVKDGYSPQEFYIQGGLQGPWSDLYSFAATIYHAITGAAPVDGQHRLSALAQKKPDPYVRLVGNVVGYPERFLDALDKALEIVPERRLQSTKAWLELLGPDSSAPKAANDQRPASKRDSLPHLSMEASAEQAAAASKPGHRRAVSAIVLTLMLGGAIYGYQQIKPATPDTPLGSDLVPAGSIASASISFNSPDIPAEASGVAGSEADLSISLNPGAVDLAVPATDTFPSVSATPPAEYALVWPDVSPLIAIPQIGAHGATFAYSPDFGDVPSLSAATAAPRLPEVSPLAPLWADATYIPLTEAPALLATATVLEPLSASSHWDVVMPFAEREVQLRAASAIEVGEVAPGTNLARAGDWIAEGATIYAINDQRLQAGKPLSGHLLDNMVIDPDGYVRATVHYSVGASGIQRGLLAVPALRAIALSDGTTLTSRVADGAWTVTVTDLGKAPFQIGDQLIGEAVTGASIDGHEALFAVLDRLAGSGTEEAKFEVVRGGQKVFVAVPTRVAQTRAINK